MSDGKYVSIILPVYNAEETIGEAILSILNQTYTHFELLIINDGSTDYSLDVINKVVAGDSRVKVVSRANLGLAVTLNELIQLASFEFIFRMDSDDICYPDRVRIQREYLRENDDCVMLGGQIDFIVGDTLLETFEMPFDHEDILNGLLEYRFLVCHPAIVFTKSSALLVGMYSTVQAGEDLDFFLKMSQVGRISNVPDKVLSYRIGLQTLSTSKSGELSKNYALAKYNYTKRAIGEVELTLSQFELIWKTNLKLRAYFYFKSLSEVFYRKSIMYRSKNKTTSYFYLVLAAVMRPQTTVKRVFGLFTGKLK
ncbi:MAG: glycosyltransferase [Colwellia sp.]